MSTTTLSPRQAFSNPFLVVERILRDRDGIWQQVANEQQLSVLTGQMLSSATLSLACYGFAMGIWDGNPLQAIASAIKLPILFLLTLAICLPTLYLFNLVFGSKLTVRQALALVMVAITVTAVLTLAFAPITLFFLLTARDYEFFKLLNVAVLTLTGAVGLSFLVGGMRRLNMLTQPVAEPATSGNAQQQGSLATLAAAEQTEDSAKQAHQTAQQPPTVNMALVWIWIVLYGFVGTQLAWTLRPYFGDPGKSFAIFRSLEGNFYVNVVRTIANLFN